MPCWNGGKHNTKPAKERDMKQGIFRIARTSARLEVNGSYFKLHQPGACITPAQLVGALEEIWSGQLLPENPNRMF